MSDTKRAPRGSGLYHSIMVRLAEDQASQLDYLCARWGRPRGTLARQIIQDGLSELLNVHSPLWVDWRTYKDGRRPAGTAGNRHPTAKQTRIASEQPLSPDEPSELPDNPHLVTILPGREPQ